MKNELYNKALSKDHQKLQKEIAKNYAKKIKELFSEGIISMMKIMLTMVTI